MPLYEGYESSTGFGVGLAFGIVAVICNRAFSDSSENRSILCYCLLSVYSYLLGSNGIIILCCFVGPPSQSLYGYPCNIFNGLSMDLELMLVILWWCYDVLDCCKWHRSKLCAVIFYPNFNYYLPGMKLGSDIWVNRSSFRSATSDSSELHLL